MYIDVRKKRTVWVRFLFVITATLLTRVAVILATGLSKLVRLSKASALPETLINTALDHRLDARISVPSEDRFHLDSIQQGSGDRDM